MKRFSIYLIIVFVILLQVTPSHAIDKGVFRLGGGGSVLSSTTDSDGLETKTTAVSVSFGYFVIENLEIGLGIEKLNIDDDFWGTEYYQTVSPGVRYYYPVSENYIFGTVFMEQYGADVEGDAVGFGAGYTAMLGDSFSFDFGFFSTSGTQESDMGSYDFDDTSIKGGFSLYFGN